MPVQLLIGAAQIALLLATVAYCGSKMYWKPHFLFQAAAQVAVFAAVVVLGLLCFMLVQNNLVLLKSLLRRFTRPVRRLADEFIILF